MKLIKLSERLSALADFIDSGANVADIGTNHGLLPVYLAQRGDAGRIFASDISAGSLKAAYRSAAGAGVTDAITFINAPGLDGIPQDEVDTIIIAGMGAETIVGILRDAPWTNSEHVTLILQPQSKVDLLTRFLYDNGYGISNTKYVFDRGKRYLVIRRRGLGMERKS